METDDLMLELEEWGHSRQILPLPEFDCPHYGECQESLRCRNPELLLDRGKTCMMSYVGRLYKEADFRLVIVGMDHRDRECGDFYARRCGIEDYYYYKKYDKSNFNDHYAGVVRTAAAIMGQAGQFCLANCWNEKKRKRTCAGQRRPESAQCVLLKIAQPNLVKCVAAKDAKCQATDKMRTNCTNHLISELELLEPKLVVFHGANARVAFLDAAQRARYRLEAIKGPTDRRGPVICKVIGKIQYFVVFLLHPSHGWLDGQWKQVVEPAIAILRSWGEIPK